MHVLWIPTGDTLNKAYLEEQSKSEEHQTAIDDTKLSIGLGKKYVNEVEDARTNAMWKMGLQSLVVYRCGDSAWRVPIVQVIFTSCNPKRNLTFSDRALAYTVNAKRPTENVSVSILEPTCKETYSRPL